MKKIALAMVAALALAVAAPASVSAQCKGTQCTTVQKDPTSMTSQKGTSNKKEDTSLKMGQPNGSKTSTTKGVKQDCSGTKCTSQSKNCEKAKSGNCASKQQCTDASKGTASQSSTTVKAK